jgi:hypothetical protein
VPGNRHAGFGRRFGETHQWQHRQDAPDRPHQRCGRPHVASWAELEVTLAADLLAGDQDPRPGAPGLLRRALCGLPAGVSEVKLRADGGYFAVDLAVAAHREKVSFAIGAKRIAPVWAALAGVNESDWVEAIEMPGAQVAVAHYRPAWWPTSTGLLIRRIALAPTQISADPRARRRRTLHPDQRTLPLDELTGTDAVYGYSFILTNLDVSTPDQAAATEHWYRHRTTIENIFRDAKHGAALRHLPSGYVEVNTAWMWGALLATSLADWLHQLTATPDPGGGLLGWGVREGKAMIDTLRHRLVCVPARLIHHAAALILRLPPGHNCSPRSSPACAPYPQRPDPANTAPTTPEPAHPRRHSGLRPAHTLKTATRRSQTRTEDHFMLLLAESGQTVRTNRSAKQFARGQRGGILTTWMPTSARTASNDAVNWPARSRTTKWNWVTRLPRSINRLRICWVVHLPSGFVVAPSRCTDRLATSSTKNT